MSNKVISFLIGLMMIAILLCFSSQVQADQDGDYTYTVTAGEAQITRYTGGEGVVTIPSRIAGFPVTSIGDYAFGGCNGLSNITIPQGLRSIGDSAFYGCTGLTTINIPKSVINIGFRALTDYTYITSITVAGDNLNYTSIDGALFNKAGNIFYLVLQG